MFAVPAAAVGVVGVPVSFGDNNCKLLNIPAELIFVNNNQADESDKAALFPLFKDL